MPITLISMSFSFYAYADTDLVGFLALNFYLRQKTYIVFKIQIITSQKRRVGESPLLKINESLAKELTFSIST